MTETEYDHELALIHKEAESRKIALSRRWATENRKFKDGEIITDHIGSGHIVRMKFSRSLHQFPEICYECIELKNDGTAKIDRKTKETSRRLVYERNVINDKDLTKQP